MFVLSGLNLFLLTLSSLYPKILHIPYLNYVLPDLGKPSRDILNSTLLGIILLFVKHKFESKMSDFKT